MARVNWMVVFCLCSSVLIVPHPSQAIQATLVIQESGYWVNTLPPWRSRPLTDMVRELTKRVGPKAQSLGLVHRRPWIPTGKVTAHIPVDISTEQLKTLQSFLTQQAPLAHSPVVLSPQELAKNEAKLFSAGMLDRYAIPVLQIPLQAEIYKSLGRKSFFYGEPEVSLGVSDWEGATSLILYLHLSGYTHSILKDVRIDGKSVIGQNCQTFLTQSR